MKKIIIVTACFVTINACSKKTVPAATHQLSPLTSPQAAPVHADTSSALVPGIISDTATTVASNATVTVMVISDANGKILTSEKDLPPDADVKFNSLQLSKGFTPQQKINLSTRYKMVPPRVLYVSRPSQLTSLRGTYYIYKKKFWYWKKSDGLFYLDEKYYL